MINKKESLFLFGDNSFNQLGIEGINLISTITNDISKNFKIHYKKISCGFSHSLILFEGGMKNKLY
jgi:alpha-tubulin suppressor-like RCC1 family protein